MKFRDFVIKDKLLNKGTKKNRLRECSGINIEPDTLVPLVRDMTERFDTSECPLERTQLILKIIYIMLSSMENSFNDDEILIEKK